MAFVQTSTASGSGQPPANDLDNSDVDAATEDDAEDEDGMDQPMDDPEQGDGAPPFEGQAAPVTLVSRKRRAELQREQREQAKAHRAATQRETAAAAAAVAAQAHPLAAQEVAAVPTWAELFHQSHAPYAVGGIILRGRCGGSPAGARRAQCCSDARRACGCCLRGPGR